MNTTPLPLLVMLPLEAEAKGIKGEEKEAEMISGLIFLNLKGSLIQTCSKISSKL